MTFDAFLSALYAVRWIPVLVSPAAAERAVRVVMRTPGSSAPRDDAVWTLLVKLSEADFIAIVSSLVERMTPEEANLAIRRVL